MAGQFVIPEVSCIVCVCGGGGGGSKVCLCLHMCQPVCLVETCVLILFILVSVQQGSIRSRVYFVV